MGINKVSIDTTSVTSTFRGSSTGVSVYQTDWSVSGWFRFANTSTQQFIWNCGSESDNRYPHFGVNGTNIFMNFYGNDYEVAHGMSANTWYHLAWTTDYNGGNTTKSIYRNGTLLGSQTAGNLVLTGVPTFYWFNRQRYDFPFKGLNDNFAFHSKCLTSQDVTDLYNGGKPRDLLTHAGTKAFLEHWYRWEASNGNDNSGKGRNMTITGTYSTSTTVP